MKWTLFDACAAIEGFGAREYTEAERVSAFQYLIDTGAAWTLQGSYGREAFALVNAGVCQPPQSWRDRAAALDRRPLAQTLHFL